MANQNITGSTKQTPSSSSTDWPVSRAAATVPASHTAAKPAIRLQSRENTGRSVWALRSRATMRRHQISTM